MSNKRKDFSRIYDQNIDRIYRFVFFRVNSQEIAEDIASEAFSRCWESYKTTDIENVSAFLYQTARNLITDYYRIKGRTLPLAEDIVLADESVNIEELADKKLDIEKIKLAIVNLNEEYQEILINHYINDLPIQEIAKMLNKSEGAARVSLHRALKALKQEIIREEV